MRTVLAKFSADVSPIGPKTAVRANPLIGYPTQRADRFFATGTKELKRRLAGAVGLALGVLGIHRIERFWCDRRHRAAARHRLDNACERACGFGGVVRRNARRPRFACGWLLPVCVRHRLNGG